MDKSLGKHFMAVILAICVAATLMGYGKASAQWKTKWQNVVKAAKKEGVVSVYASSMAGAVRGQTATFKKLYGIKIEVTSGRGSQLARKLTTEKSAGINLADVLISGGNSVFRMKELGITAPMDNKLILPEVSNPKHWYTLTHLPWLDDNDNFFHFLAYPNRDIAINTDLVKPGAIQSWKDLLKPQFKGKIVWNDPTVAGSGFNGVATNLMNHVNHEDYYRKMVASQNIQLGRNQRQMADWLARGKYAVSISIPGGALGQFFRAGAHIAYVRVKEGTYLSYDGGNVGVTANPPHPNAAIVYVNWLLTKAGQTFAQRDTRYMSSRNDLPVKDVNPDNRRIPGERYFVGCNTIESWLKNDQAKALKEVKKLFAPLEQ